MDKKQYKEMKNSACFRQFFCPPSGVFHCTHSSGMCHTGLLTACEQDQEDQDGTEFHPDLLASCQQTCMTHAIAVCKAMACVIQRNCPKHVEFYSKNKFEKLVHLVGFILRTVVALIFYFSNLCPCYSDEEIVS